MKANVHYYLERKYRVKSIVIILFFLISTQLIAHEMGLKLGVNHTVLAGDNDLSFLKSRILYNFGIWGNYNINNKYALSTEVNYIKKGFKQKTAGTDEYGNEIEPFTSYDDFNYIEVPILINIWINNSVAMVGGGNVAYLISASHHSNSSGNKFDLDISEDINTFDLGVIIGVTFKYQLFNQNFINDIRYNISLNSLYKNSDWDVAHLQCLSISMGYIFSL